MDVLDLSLHVILYTASAFTLAMGLGLLYAYRDSRRRRLLFLAAVYLWAGILAIISATWWPIIFGFLLAVGIRGTRLDLHVTDRNDRAMPTGEHSGSGTDNAPHKPPLN